jgi:hypothetical protein
MVVRSKRVNAPANPAVCVKVALTFRYLKLTTVTMTSVIPKIARIV